ncbi:MAG: hypothetical protein FWD57_14290, partial [Polyangiaceae bacterium]|nr:hypothetical protein [Polyangiaceae bacterium]
GNRFKLIDAILEAQNREKDSGLRERLERYPVPRLFDMYKSLSKRKARTANQSKTDDTKPTDAMVDEAKDTEQAPVEN